MIFWPSLKKSQFSPVNDIALLSLLDPCLMRLVVPLEDVAGPSTLLSPVFRVPIELWWFVFFKLLRLGAMDRGWVVV